jgi:prevent-host-death family protein
MKTATVADLRNHFPKIASWLAAGEQVRVTRRGKPLAKIVPDREQAESPQRPDFAGRRKRYWGNHRVLSQKDWDDLKDLEVRGTREDTRGC